jgi:hypothetical protein
LGYSLKNLANFISNCLVTLINGVNKARSYWRHLFVIIANRVDLCEHHLRTLIFQTIISSSGRFLRSEKRQGRMGLERNP